MNYRIVKVNGHFRLDKQTQSGLFYGSKEYTKEYDLIQVVDDLVENLTEERLDGILFFSKTVSFDLISEITLRNPRLKTIVEGIEHKIQLQE